MTNEHVQKAAQLMADAYKAGYAGKPMSEDDFTHAVLWFRYLLGKQDAETGKESVFGGPRYVIARLDGVGALSKVEESRAACG